MDYTGHTEPTTSVEEMTVFLASDLGIDPEKVIMWTISIVVDMDSGYGMVNRISNAEPNPMVILGQIQAICQAVTGAVDV